MLEIRNITKIYKSKTGEQVKALDNVSIQFPESGMVFVLGKSGSGKSTLLNVIGGLDGCDSGEFVIMGKSSKDFAGSDFDAYRNTFIGFIFQEYNILEDFTVGANIGLALELQGRKATSEAITNILAQVDLVGYAARKPNELSGGQKQRVAIARALVKEPQIIMADEPTGALDSNTGKQIFDALKELSKTKLVLVVSHDRDFAERYADRIIEMSDGHVVEDVTKHCVEAERVSEGIQCMGKNMLRIEKGYQLTAKDLELINAYLRENAQEVLLSGDARINEELRSAAGITKDGSTAMFESTAPEKDIKIKEYDGKKTRFIRSRLPMKNALRIGASGLKHKTFRLILTILLSLVAFGMFGLADTMAAYNKITAATESILDSNIRTAAFSLGVRTTYYWDDEVRNYYDNGDYTFNEQDIADLKEKTGLALLPVFNGEYSTRGSISYSSYFENKGDYLAYPGSLTGFVNVDNEQKLADYGLSLAAGKMPTADDEITITEHTFRQFQEYGFKNSALNEKVEAGKLNKNESDANSILGKHLSLNIGMNNQRQYKIVGVVETNFDYGRYASFLPSDSTDLPEGNDLIEMFFASELQTTLNYGFHCLAFLTQSEINTLSNSMYRYHREIGTYMHSMQVYLSKGDVEWNDNYGWSGSMSYLGTVAKSEALASLGEITWLDGTPRTTLGAKEIVVSAYALQSLMTQKSYQFDFSAIDNLAHQRYGSHYTDGDKDQGYYYRIEQAIADHYRATSGNEWDWPEQSYIDNEWKNFTTVVLDVFGLEAPSDLTAEENRFVLQYLLNQFSANNEYESYHFTWVRSYAAVALDIFAGDLMKNDRFVEEMMSYYGMSTKDLPDDWDELSDVEKLYRYNLQDTYYNWLQNMGRDKNEYSTLTGAVLEKESTEALLKAAGITVDALYADIQLNAMIYDYSNGTSTMKAWMDFSDWKIVGTFSADQSNLLVSDDFYNRYVEYSMANGYSINETAPHENGIYSFVLAPMGSDNSVIEQLVKLHYEEQGDTTYYLQNHVMHTLSSFNDFIEEGAKIFVWVGLGFALFASLLLMNFIAISISYKKREIGILRAVGARSSDVFKIFFSEALLIALINFILAVVAVVVAIFALNNWMRGEGINVTLLTFGVRQIALMLGVSVGVALLSSFLPVYKIARRKPVDAIKDR